MSDDNDAGVEGPPRAAPEHRAVADWEVRWADRTIEMVAMPYERDAPVIVHGRLVTETCAPGAFDGVERRANRVKVNRDHDTRRIVGRAVALHPSRDEGLVTELRIAQTLLGDETLGLAEDRALEPSVSFIPMPEGEEWSLDRRRRRLTRVFLDHLAMVPEGAYGGDAHGSDAPGGARVLAVRSATATETEPPARVPTPNLDEVKLWLATDAFGRDR